MNKKIIWALRLTSCLFAVLSSGSWIAQQNSAASVYYISSTFGNDKNDGLSPARAWRSLSQIHLKSDSEGKFRSGDKILLKRGDRWDGQIRLDANGTAQNPVVLGSYGEGPKPSMYGDNPQLQWEPVAGHLGIYAADMGRGSVLGALFMAGKNTRAVYPGGSLNRIDYLEGFLAELQSGVFAGQYDGRLWIRTPDRKPSQETVRVFRYAGVMVADSSYVQVEDLDIQRFYVGIDVTTSKDVVIHHNDIQDVLGIGIYLRSGDVNCLVESNTVHRSGNTALYVLKGDKNTFRDNWVSHVDSTVLGIAMAGDKMGVGLQESQHSLVEYNYFSDSGGMDFFHEAGSSVRYNYLERVRSAGSPNGTDLNLYGNIYNLGGDEGERGSVGINVGVTGDGSIAVFNNTIVNAASYFLMGSSKNAGTILFSDNLLLSTARLPAMTVFGANVTSTHNCFFTLGQPVFTYSNQKFSSLKSYQDATGLDRDSIFADPQFAVQHPSVPLEFRVGQASACNSPARFIPPRTPSDARTYDHDRPGDGTPIMGAFGANRNEGFVPTSRVSCKIHCFERAFAVHAGVYLISLTFSPAVLTQGTEFHFTLNGRKVVADFDSAVDGDANHPLRRRFIVRPEGFLIVLGPDANQDLSVVSGVEIEPFDTDHGRGLQVVAW
jgi:parallel beta helix pectate lyase-like protein